MGVDENIKDIVLEAKTSERDRRVFVGLVSAVVVLTVALVTLVACGSWYVETLGDTCEKATPEQQPNGDKSRYDVKVIQNYTEVHEKVVVDGDKETVFYIARAPHTNHITHMVADDYGRKLTVIYESETQDCLFAKMDDDVPGFQENLDRLRSKEDVREPKTLNYSVEEPLTDADHVPDEMILFCSPSNSYWLEKMYFAEEEEEKEKRVKRHWPSRCHWGWWRCYWRYVYGRFYIFCYHTSYYRWGFYYRYGCHYPWYG